jgi:hypothetical protein
MSSQYHYFTAMLLYVIRVLPTLIIRSAKYCSTQPLVWTISYVGVVKGKNLQKGIRWSGSCRMYDHRNVVTKDEYEIRASMITGPVFSYLPHTNMLACMITGTL